MFIPSIECYLFYYIGRKLTATEIAEKLAVDVDRVCESLEYWENESVLLLTADGSYMLSEE